MLVRRLCSQLPTDSKVRADALEYLVRKNLQGSILRTALKEQL
jgi:hypothetical protein